MPKQTQTDLIHRMDLRNAALAQRLRRHKGAQRLLEGRLGKDGYCAYVAQSGCYVEHSSRFLMLTSKKMKRYPELAVHLYKKSLEEKNHHQWCWSDLKRLGWTDRQVKGIQPCPAVQGYLTYHEAAAKRGTPEIAGTAYCLETLSGTNAGKVVERLVRNGRIEHIREATMYLSRHGDLDDGHSVELAEPLRAVDRSEWPHILLAMDMVESLLIGIFDEVARVEHRGPSAHPR